MSLWSLLDAILESWAGRAALTPAQVAALGEEVKARAFTLARVWETRFLEDVQASLGKAMQDGETLAAWLPKAQKLLDGYGGSVLLHGGGDRWTPWYAELVLRNAVQGSYAGGRYSAMWGPEWVVRAPYWRYHATLDARTRPSHAALHGKVFRKDDPEARVYLPPSSHNCFPAETPILGSIRAGVRSRYSGPVVRIQTGAGHRLTLTVDHPVLTPRGWVAAKLLREGDHVLSHVAGPEGGLDAARTDEAVRGILGPRKTRLAAPRLNVHGRPAFAGELFCALPEAFRESRLGVRSKDLYGDARIEERHVEVEREHRELLLHAKAAAAQLVRDLRLALVHVDHAFVAGLRHADALLERHLAAASGIPGLRELALDGGGVGLQAIPLQPFSFASTADGNAHPAESTSERSPCAPGLLRELVHGLAGYVARSESHVGRALGLDLGPNLGPDRLELGEHLRTDTVTEVREGSFVGEVFDFETAHGWMVASGIVISNCRCQAIEMTVDEFEDGGYRVTDGTVVATLPTNDGGMVGRPEGSWDVDRVTATRSRVLSGATPAPPK